MRTAEEILKVIDEEGVEFVRLQFTDIYGNLKNVAVTANQLKKVLIEKYRVDGAVLFGNDGYYDGELLLKPDYSTFMILPWRPQQGKVAKFMCDICMPDGSLFDMSGRTILKKVIDDAREMGYTFMIRPECEFFLFHLNEDGLPTTITHEQAGLMDVGPVDFGENARREMVLLLEQMGFEIESSHHEKAPAQHEIDFKELDTLHSADSIMSFRFAVRSIAKRFGLYATFMPKPKSNEAGSGMHLNISVYKNGRNIMESEDEEIAKEAGYFMSGIYEHAKSLCAYTNPTVNSYKRIMAGQDAPDSVLWGSGRKSTYIRLRENLFEPAIELRFPDSSANPYLALALCIATGINGIKDKKDIVNSDRIELSKDLLPRDLKEAAKCAFEDDFISEIVGSELNEIYCNHKIDEWNDYMHEISEWEITQYLYKL